MSLTARLADLRLPRARAPGASSGLAVCLPRRLRRWLAARRPVLVVVPSGDDATLWRQCGDEREVVGSIDLRTNGRLSTVVVDPRSTWTETALELPASAVLLRGLALPVAVRDQLHQVVGYELDRLTPFAPAEVYYDVQAVGSVARGAKLDVRLAVCRRDRVVDWLERLREGDSPAGRLTWVGAWPGANLLPTAERPRPKRLGAILGGLLLLLVGGLVAAVLVTPLWQQTARQADLQRSLNKLRIQAQEVGSVREELERARLGSVAVLQRKRDQPRMTDLLRDLTDLLADGTWVQTLNVRGADVDLRGESTQATALIGLLEQSPVINTVAFGSPVMQVPATGAERYHIVLKYQPEPPP